MIIYILVGSLLLFGILLKALKGLEGSAKQQDSALKKSHF